MSDARQRRGSDLFYSLFMRLGVAGGKCLCQVGQNVVDMFQSDRQTHHIFPNPCGSQFCCIQLPVGSRCGVAGQGFGIADFDQPFYLFKRVVVLRAGDVSALDAERQDAGGFSPHVFLCQGMLGVIR